MAKKIHKEYLFLMLMFLTILIVLPFSYGEENWFTWGNYHSKNNPEALFASNYPVGSIEFNAIYYDTISMLYPPIIADLDNNNQNEIYITTSAGISAYSPSLELLGSTASFTPATNPVILNYGFDDTLEIAVTDDTYTLRIYNFDGDGFTLSDSFYIRSEGLLEYSDFALGSEISYINNTKHAVFDFEDPLNPYQKETNDFLQTGVYDYYQLQYGSAHGLSIDDTNKDGLLEYWAVGGTNTCYVGSYYINTTLYEECRWFWNPPNPFDWEYRCEYANTGGVDIRYIVSPASVESSTDIVSGTIASANIGSSSSAKEVFADCRFGLDDTTKEFEKNIYDSTGTVKLSFNTGLQDTAGMTNTVVADIDHDGENEFCFGFSKTTYSRDNASVYCYDSDYTLRLNLTYPYPERKYLYMASAEYNTSNDYMEFIFPDGIYEVNPAGDNLTKIFDIGISNNKTMLMPVTLVSKTTGINDLVVVNADEIKTFISSGAPIVCGDGMCDSGETTITCFEDCYDLDVSEEQIKITRVEICPDISYMWHNGTRVKITAKVEALDGSTVQASAYLYAGTSNEWSSGFSPSQPSGNNFVFDTFANHTGFGTLKIIGRKSTLTGISDIYSEQFVVDSSEGISYGDGCFILNDPLTGSATGRGDVSDPCDSGDDCDTGLCEYGYCTLKTGGLECSSGSECLSGECINYRCKKENLWLAIMASKTQQFGDDSMTNNFIALFFMIGIPIAIIFAGGSSGHVIAACVVGLVSFICLAFFFTIAGLLSPFILFGIIIIILMVIVLAVVLGAGSG